MRTTLNIDDQLLNKAQRITGLSEKSALVREGLKALIERESARRVWHGHSSKKGDFRVTRTDLVQKKAILG